MDYVSTATPLRERQKQMTRELIAETARRLFLERGFDAVTVSEIAREAGVAQKTVFNHFPTKEDLFYSRMESFEQELLEAIRTRDPGSSILDAFVAFVSQPRGFLASHDPGAAARLREITTLITGSVALLAREQQIYAQYTATLAGMIERETGAGKHDVAPFVAANALIGIHRALIDLVREQVMSGNDDLKAIARSVRSQARQARTLLERGLL
jgi:AcrR family transcriptional regulator